MAPKDYVKRPQKRKPSQVRKKTPSRNNRGGKNTRAQVDATNTPWFRIVSALLLIVGFVYGLYVLQKADVNNLEQSTDTVSPNDSSAIEPNNANNTETPLLEVSNSQKIELEKTQNQGSSQNQQVKPLQPLPVLGEEEWDFIDSLPEFSVEVDATGPMESDREYIMQCGSFRTVDRAQQLKARLALQGYESRIIVSNGGKWHRVVLGPYESKREAEKDRHVLRRADIQRCKIW